MFIVPHEVLRARSRTQIDRLFLEQIAARELRDVEVHAGLRFVIERRLFECIALQVGHARGRIPDDH